MRHFLRLVTCAQLIAWLCGTPAPAFSQTLVGETVTATFVTMTKGAKCPSTMTVDFVSQGSASGTLEGLHDEHGSLRLTQDEATGRITIAAFASTFEINKAVSGELVWESSSAKPLQMSCDPLSLRIDGEVRYRVFRPFVEVGTARLQIWGVREVITEPFFGRSVTTFAGQ